MSCGSCRALAANSSWTVLSETTLAGLIGGQNVRERMEFGNCHQFNPRWQFLFDIIKILFYHSVKDLLESKKPLLFEYCLRPSLLNQESVKSVK